MEGGGDGSGSPAGTPGAPSGLTSGTVNGKHRGQPDSASPESGSQRSRTTPRRPPRALTFARISVNRKGGPMTCGSCGTPLPEATARRRFCGNACRARYRRERLAKTIGEARRRPGGRWRGHRRRWGVRGRRGRDSRRHFKTSINRPKARTSRNGPTKTAMSMLRHASQPPGRPPQPNLHRHFIEAPSSLGGSVYIIEGGSAVGRSILLAGDWFIREGLCAVPSTLIPFALRGADRLTQQRVEPSQTQVQALQSRGRRENAN